MPTRATWQRWGRSSRKVSQHPETSHATLELQNVIVDPNGPIPPHRIPARKPRERHHHPFCSLPPLVPFLQKQISVAHFSNRLQGLTLLWTNRYTSDCAFNIVKSWGTAQRAVLCSTCTPCYLPVAAFPAGKASGSPFLFLSWKLLVEALPASVALRNRQLGMSALVEIGTKAAFELSQGSEAQRPRVSSWLGHPHQAGSLKNILIIKLQQSSKSTTQVGKLRQIPRETRGVFSRLWPLRRPPQPPDILAAPGLPTRVPRACGPLETPGRQLRSRKIHFI